MIKYIGYGESRRIFVVTRSYTYQPMKKLTPLLVVLILLFGCKKNTEDNEPNHREVTDYKPIDSAHVWYSWIPKNSRSKVHRDKTTSHTGKFSVVIISAEDSIEKNVGFGSSFDYSEPFLAHRIRFSYWAKVKDMEGVASASVFVYKPIDDIPTDVSTNPFDITQDFIKDNTGIDLESKRKKLSKHFYDHSGYLDKSPITNTDDWKQYHIEVDVPHRAPHVRIAFGVEGKGTLWIDDVTYEKIKKLPTDSTFVDRSEFLPPITGLDFE